MCVFCFCQDVRKQQQMAQLTKERDHIFETIRTYRLLFETTRQLINEMQGSVHFPFIVFYSETPHEKIVLCLALCFYRVYITNSFCALFDWFLSCVLLRDRRIDDDIARFKFDSCVISHNQSECVDS